MFIPSFTGSLSERMRQLVPTLSGHSGIRLVGSSFGGLMATLFTMEDETRVDRLVLLAPAINLLWFTPHPIKPISIPVWIYHGRNDEVIPLKAVEYMAKKYFTDLSLNQVDDDHFLHNTFKTIDWDVLLGPGSPLLNPEPQTPNQGGHSTPPSPKE